MRFFSRALPMFSLLAMVICGLELRENWFCIIAPQGHCTTPLLTSLFRFPFNGNCPSGASTEVGPQQVQGGDFYANAASDPTNSFNCTGCKYPMHAPGNDCARFHQEGTREPLCLFETASGNGSKGTDCSLGGVLHQLHVRSHDMIYPTASPTMVPMNRSIFDGSSTRAPDETGSSATGIPAIVIVLVALCTMLLFFFCVLSSDGCEKRRNLFAQVRPSTDAQTEDLDGSEV